VTEERIMAAPAETLTRSVVNGFRQGTLNGVGTPDRYNGSLRSPVASLLNVTEVVGATEKIILPEGWRMVSEAALDASGKTFTSLFKGLHARVTQTFPVNTGVTEVIFPAGTSTRIRSLSTEIGAHALSPYLTIDRKDPKNPDVKLTLQTGQVDITNAAVKVLGRPERPTGLLFILPSKDKIKARTISIHRDEGGEADVNNTIVHVQPHTKIVDREIDETMPGLQDSDLDAIDLAHELFIQRSLISH